MNRPTTRTEQMLASASKGVSSRLILAEAARFVEPGEIFVDGLIQGSSGRLASPRVFRCSRVCDLTGVYQTSVPRRVFRTIWIAGVLSASFLLRLTGRRSGRAEDAPEFDEAFEPDCMEVVTGDE